MEPARQGSESPGIFARLGLRVATFGTLFKAVWNSPYWWLVPFVGVLAIFAFVLVATTAFPAVAPFVYALF